MGKGEELHMELEFDRDVIHCWEIAVMQYLKISLAQKF